jgi:hypothetical protein
MTSPVNGSQRLLQAAVNHRPESLQSALRRCGAIGRREELRWVSPLSSDGFREYSGGRALAKLGLLQRLRSPLREFWPARGCVWDALELAGDSRPVLVEAKAHVAEAVSSGTPPPTSLAR